MATTIVDKAAVGKAEQKAEKKARQKREPYQENYPTAEAAIKEASSRVKGPRRAFKTSFGGKTFFVVAHNEGRAGGVAFQNLGGQVEALGVTRRAAKPANLLDVLKTLDTATMGEAEKASIVAQLKALGLV